MDASSIAVGERQEEGATGFGRNRDYQVTFRMQDKEKQGSEVSSLASNGLVARIGKSGGYQVTSQEKGRSKPSLHLLLCMRCSASFSGIQGEKIHSSKEPVHK